MRPMACANLGGRTSSVRSGDFNRGLMNER
jgi:hypothetical protein